jgi:ArsR family transcriptional regulator, arsenate/arsenite/antimonite-responsive transcriptional repressor / arsenate reductase (thioredoxin)
VTTAALDAAEAVAGFAALGHASRLETLRLLARYLPFGLPAGDIARLIGLPHNTLSSHLSVLEQAGLVLSRRQGRSIIYAANQARMVQLTQFLLRDGCRADASFGDTIRGAVAPVPSRRETPPMTKPANVLILCTGNSARSILAEAILNREGAGRFRAYSAGSQPKGEPNPHALSLLSELGYDIGGLRSKSWDEFAGPGAPAMDFIVTVCDSAAGEACPFWPGHPLVAHWGIPDPAGASGTQAQIRAAFMEAYRRLATRFSEFVNLDIETQDLASLKASLAAIGAMEGATPLARQGQAA